MFKLANTITISVEEYEDLLDKKRWLDYLEGCGVDCWEGYDYAREMYQEGESDD